MLTWARPSSAPSPSLTPVVRASSALHVGVGAPVCALHAEGFSVSVRYVPLHGLLEGAHTMRSGAISRAPTARASPVRAHCRQIADAVSPPRLVAAPFARNYFASASVGT